MGMIGMPEVLEIELGPEIAELTRVLDAVEEFGEANRLPAQTVSRLGLVLDELISNIIKYGLAAHDHGEIRLTVALEAGAVGVLLSDNGKPFNPLAAPVEEVATSLDDSKIGGHGIRFVRAFVDRLDYERDGEFNRLRLQISPHSAEPPQK
jgi:serine/threonine-protein kinase RsbW